MIRDFKEKIRKFITEKIPDPVKLVFFYGLAFYAGYLFGDFGYKNYNSVIEIVCNI